MRCMRITPLLVLVLLASATQAWTADFVITGCQNLTQAGHYSLDRDVETNATCFTVQSNGVSLHCNSHSITQTRGILESNAGFYNPSFDYASVYDCTFQNFAYGIRYHSVAATLQGGNIENNIVQNGPDGLWVQNTDGLQVRNNRLYDAHFTSSTNSLVENNEFTLENTGSVYLQNSDANSFRANSYAASYASIWLKNSNSNTFQNEVFSSLVQLEKSSGNQFTACNIPALLERESSSENNVTNPLSFPTLNIASDSSARVDYTVRARVLRHPEQTPIASAAINASDASGNAFGPALQTDSQGYTPWFKAAAFNGNTAQNNPESPYTLLATANGYQDGSATDEASTDHTTTLILLLPGATPTPVPTAIPTPTSTPTLLPETIEGDEQPPSADEETTGSAEDAANPKSTNGAADGNGADENGAAGATTSNLYAGAGSVNNLNANSGANADTTGTGQQSGYGLEKSSNPNARNPLADNIIPFAAVIAVAALALALKHFHDKGGKQDKQIRTSLDLLKNPGSEPRKRKYF